MNDAWDPTKDGEEDVDQKITTASTLEEDTQRWEEEGKDDLADVAAGNGALVLMPVCQCLPAAPRLRANNVQQLGGAGRDKKTYEAVKGILSDGGVERRCG